MQTKSTLFQNKKISIFHDQNDIGSSHKIMVKTKFTQKVGHEVHSIIIKLFDPNQTRKKIGKKIKKNSKIS